MYFRDHISNSSYVVVAMVALLLLTTQFVFAHHGWGWATDEEFEITGKVTEVSLGNPHGEVMIEVDGKVWTVQVGQPWRNDRAGLSESLLREGVEITVHGHRSTKEEELLVKAEAVIIDGEEYLLYPDREQ